MRTEHMDTLLLRTQAYEDPRSLSSAVTVVVILTNRLQASKCAGALRSDAASRHALSDQLAMPGQSALKTVN